MNFLNLTAFLGLNASGFQIGMKQAESAAKAFSNNIKGEFARAFGYTAIIAFAKSVMDTADRVVDLSDKLGISTKSLQEWSYAAKKSGSDAEAVARFFENLSLAREKALSGDQSTLLASQRFGLDQGDWMSLSTEQIGMKIAEAVRKSGSNMIAPLREIGGKAASELIPAFKSGIAELAQAGHDAGQIMDDTVLASIKRFKSEIESVTDVFRGPMASAIVWVAGQVSHIVDLLNIGIGGLGAFMGTFAGGGSAADAKRAAYEHANRVVDARIKREQELAAAGAGSSAGEDWGLSGAEGKAAQRSVKWGRMKMHNFMPKELQSHGLQQSLNSWQQMGSAIRGNSPEIGPLKSIEKNTQRTVEKLDIIQKMNRGLAAQQQGVKFS